MESIRGNKKFINTNADLTARRGKGADMIETFGNGYTVFFEGDEIYFDTYEEAEQFIKEMGWKE